MQEMNRPTSRSRGSRKGHRQRRSRHLNSDKGVDYSQEASQSSVDETTTPRMVSRGDASQKTGGNSTSRVFVSTNSSLFFETDHTEKGKMKPIPISPMFEAKSGIGWASEFEFYGRGATSNGSRPEKTEPYLPNLDSARSGKEKRSLFARDLVNDSMCTSPISTSPTNASPINRSSSLVTVSRGGVAGGRRARPSLSASSVRPSPIKDMNRMSVSPRNTEDKLFFVEEKQNSDIEPWAFKIISKYQGGSIMRPQSRCTARSQQDTEGIVPCGPPMVLGAMTKSKSCSHMIGTKHNDRVKSKF